MLLLTQPWNGTADPVGVLFALAAACCWAAYILLTQKVGDEVSGITGLAVSMPVAALVATPWPARRRSARMNAELWLVGLGMALLLPVVPFTLELLALRRLTTACVRHPDVPRARDRARASACSCWARCPARWPCSGSPSW